MVMNALRAWYFIHGEDSDFQIGAGSLVSGLGILSEIGNHCKGSQVTSESRRWQSKCVSR